MANPKAEYLAKKGMLGLEAFDAAHHEPDKFEQMFPGIQVADAGMLGMDPADRQAEMAAAFRDGAPPPAQQAQARKPASGGGQKIRSQETADLNERLLRLGESPEKIKEYERTGQYPKLPSEE